MLLVGTGQAPACQLMTQSGPMELGRRVRLFVFDGCRSRNSVINPRSYHQT